MKKGFNIRDEEKIHSSNLKKWKEDFQNKAQKTQPKKMSKKKK
jgi:hypothetical protein